MIQQSFQITCRVKAKELRSLYSHCPPPPLFDLCLASLEDKDAQSGTFLQLEGWSLGPGAFLCLRAAVVILEDLQYVSVLITPLSMFQLIPLLRICSAMLCCIFSSTEDPCGTDHSKSGSPGHLGASLCFEAFGRSGQTSPAHVTGEN